VFRFIELSLHGWDLWPSMRIPLDRHVILVSGPNGSGKTTLLDSIRQLLNAPRLSSRRRLQHYLRHPDKPALLRAVVSNEAGERPAPFQRERILTPEVTLACALVPTSSGVPEKRFAVRAGRPSIDELRELLLESRDWLGAERYARVLESAGVTRSLMGVLAVEQGRTNSLFELKPRELFQRVLEMLGDRAVLDRYREARARYDETRRELLHQKTALQTKQIELQTALRTVKRLDDFDEARKKITDLEATLPAAQLQERLKRKRELDPTLQTLRTRIARAELDIPRLHAELAATRTHEGQAKILVESLKARVATADAAHTAAVERRTKASAEVERVESVMRELETLPLLNRLEAESLLEAGGRVLYEAQARSERIESELKEIDLQIAKLKDGLPLHPDEVTHTLEALELRGVSYELLASKCEVTDEALGEAVEAALGDARYALIVADGALDAAVDIATPHRFPGPIWSGRKTNVDLRVGPLAINIGAPEWLPTWLKNIELNSAGRWRDERGTWVSGAPERVLGARANEAELVRRHERRHEITSTLEPAKETVRKAEEDANLLRERRDIAARREWLNTEVQGLPAQRNELKHAEAAFGQAVAHRQTEQDLHEKAGHQLHEASKQRETEAEEVDGLEKQIDGDRTALTNYQREAEEIDRALADAVGKISGELLARAHRGALDGAGTVQKDLENARRRLDDMGDAPPETSREEARHMQKNVEELEGHVTSREMEVGNAERELAACRERYVSLVSATLSAYRDRVQTIARVAELEFEMDLPKIEADERSLDEGRIDVRIGFDGKELLPLGDASFSGGQQVIAGLVLLMGMAETDGRGFFMLDEPFAHLSLDRVDQVGRFLRATRSQFVLTAPTTLDRAQLDPASLVVVLRKKRQGEANAPAPIVAEA
jgi:DNA repair exonuclease SbcCD ATPase subunit